MALEAQSFISPDHVGVAWCAERNTSAVLLDCSQAPPSGLLFLGSEHEVISVRAVCLCPLTADWLDSKP